MPITTPSGRQILDGSIQRADLDSTTVGQAVIRKIIQGTGININSTGADSGTGDVTISSASISVSDIIVSGLPNSDIVSGDDGDIVTVG